MGRHKIEKTNLENVLKIIVPVHVDERGVFREFFRKKEIEKVLGYEINIEQANISHSKHNTVRGIHIAPWNKIVTCSRGVVQQVVIDTRQGSPTFGQYFSTIMCMQDGVGVFIPAGCGNAFLTLSKDADYVYNTTAEWTENREISLAWNDPDLNIDWDARNPKPGQRDANNLSFAEFKHKELKP